MSDLAPFVAATLRDKVVDDLLAENQKLRSELSASRSLKVTSNHQGVEYSTGSLEEGHFHRNNTNNLWVVPLQSLREVPLKELRTFEVYYGGALQLAFLYKPQVYLNNVEYVREDGDQLLKISIDPYRGGMIQYLSFTLKNCSIESLAALAQVAVTNNADPIELLTRDGFIENHCPEGKVKFVEAIVPVDDVANVIDGLPLQGSDAEARESRRLYRKVYRVVSPIYVDHYGIDESDDDEQYAHAIVEQLVSQGITNVESEEFRAQVIEMIQAAEAEDE